MDALEVRAAAAADLVGKGLIDGTLALSYVLWPSEAVEAASETVAAEGARRGQHPERTRRRALELVDAGWSWAAAAREVGVPKTTIGTWVKKRKLGRGARNANPGAKPVWVVPPKVRGRRAEPGEALDNDQGDHDGSATG